MISPKSFCYISFKNKFTGKVDMDLFVENTKTANIQSPNIMKRISLNLSDVQTDKQRCESELRFIQTNMDHIIKCNAKYDSLRNRYRLLFMW